MSAHVSQVRDWLYIVALETRTLPKLIEWLETAFPPEFTKDIVADVIRMANDFSVLTRRNRLVQLIVSKAEADLIDNTDEALADMFEIDQSLVTADQVVSTLRERLMVNHADTYRTIVLPSIKLAGYTNQHLKLPSGDWEIIVNLPSLTMADPAHTLQVMKGEIIKFFTQWGPRVMIEIMAALNDIATTDAAISWLGSYCDSHQFGTACYDLIINNINNGLIDKRARKFFNNVG